MRRLQCLFTSDKPTSHNIHKCIFTILQHRSMLQYSTPLFQSYNTDRLQKTTTFIPTMGGKKPQMVQKIVIIWPYYIYILYTYIHIHAHIARCTELTLSFHNFRPLKKKGGGGRNWRVWHYSIQSSELKGATGMCPCKICETKTKDHISLSCMN